ncbi:MAG: phosphotransferase, partial [Aeromicrobium sp.]
MDTPAAEVEIDEALITRLVEAQHPDLAGPVRIVASGWDNVVARLGDELAVRLPRRAMAAPLVEHEARWLPVLAPLLRVPIPAPVRVGHLTGDYPWTWVITPWFEGVPVTALPVQRRRQIAAELGAAQSPLHVCAAIEAPANSVRGGPLATREAMIREQATQVERGDEL